MTANILQAAWVTFLLASVTTFILICTTPPLAWWLARTRKKWRAPVEALIALPLVLPPTVLGFYLLILMAPSGPLGAVWNAVLNAPLAFTFAGLVIGSIIYSLPFVAGPLTAAFRTTDAKLLEAAAALGASPIKRFTHLVLPMHRRALAGAAILGFAHTVGEFGIVLMIGGNIPGETRVLSIALFDEVEALNYDAAHIVAGGLVLFALVILSVTYRWVRVPA
ncbi:MAG: molybdate ABC transporter permease subunit [Gammaproteobacteria bacterium]|nr:molybdate ABC transporter permease subunit [Gammaproteobacteria bacterium]